MQVWCWKCSTWAARSSTNACLKFATACFSRNPWSHHRWQHTLFKTLPKPGDSTQASNWRPIAVLKITYKVFAKLLGARIHNVLEDAQCADQVGFRSKLGIDYAFAVLETMIGKSIEWDTPLWCASLDLRKAFDRIEHPSLFEALHDQGVPQCYISLLSALCRSQTGQVQAGRSFQSNVESNRVMCSVRHFSMLALNSHLRDGSASCRNTGYTLVEQNVLQTYGMQITYCCLPNH